MVSRLCCLAAVAVLLAAAPRTSRAQTAIIGSSQGMVRIRFYPKRQHPDDLEVGGDLYGVQPGKTRFVTYDDLLKLPQVTAAVNKDENFTGPVTVSGVDLGQLPGMLGANFGAHMVTAICDDSYNAHYPVLYLQRHHPILVLRINGLDHAHWPPGVDNAAMGPYMISHADFTPSLKVLSHEEEPQVPWGVVRLDFRREAEVYGPIAPRGPNAADPVVQQGYTIARENCFRCHDANGDGGTKAHRSWAILAKESQADPDWFAQYVRDPKSINPKSQMAASPGYDDATLAALRAYFAGSAEDKPNGPVKEKP